MIFFWIFLICLVIGLIEAYIFHNSVTCGNKPCTLPLVMWILLGISLFIPVLNIVLVAVMGIGMALEFSDNEMRLSDNHWLGKRY